MFWEKKRRNIGRLTLQEAKQMYLKGEIPYRYAVCRTNNIPYALLDTYDSAKEEVDDMRRFDEMPCFKIIDLLSDI